MAFENKTIEDVNNLIISSLENELNTKFRLLPKAFVRVLSKVMSGVYISLYRQQAWIFLQMFVATASFDEVEIFGKKIRPLVKWGDLVGIGEPASATQFIGQVKVTATKINSYLLAGTQFLNPATGKIYLTTENYLLKDQENEIEIKCSELGSAGNLDVGDELQTTSPLVNIEKIAVCTKVSSEANDEEDEASYRSRVIARWRVQPQGGALADYRKWASDVAGVLQTYIYKDDDSAAGVLIFVVANTDDRIPSSDLLVQVGEACSYDPSTGLGRKPIGAILDPDNNGTYKNVKACSVLDFDVYINGYSEDELSSFTSSVKSDVAAYFLQREPFVRGLSVDNERTDRISAVNISGIVNDIAEGLNGHFESIVLKKSENVIESYILGKGELAKLNKIYINGVEV